MALRVLAFCEGQPDFSHPDTLDPKFPGFGLHMVQAACTLHLQICLLVCDPASPVLLLPFSLALCQQAGNYWSRRDRRRRCNSRQQVRKELRSGRACSSFTSLKAWQENEYLEGPLDPGAISF